MNGPFNVVSEKLRSWLQASLQDGEAPQGVNAEDLSVDLEDILESGRGFNLTVERMLREPPSWDVLETALYEMWSHMIHVNHHWNELVSSVGDDELRVVISSDKHT